MSGPIDGEPETISCRPISSHFGAREIARATARASSATHDRTEGRRTRNTTPPKGRSALSHVCAGHNTSANQNLCVLETIDSLAMHAAGHAVDFHPTNRTPQECAKLWQVAGGLIATYNQEIAAHAGEPGHAALPDGCIGLTMSARPDIQSNLHARTPLRAADAAVAVFHLAFAPSSIHVVWECWLEYPSAATAARLESGAVIAVYPTQQLANQAHKDRTTPVVAASGGFAARIRVGSKAMGVRLSASSVPGGGGGIVAMYNNHFEAEAEKGTGYGWPREIA